MKNATTIKSLLGFTQEETAVLLGVSRGQWSMYVAGKRDLPSDAKKQFIAMLSLQNAKATFHEKEKFVASEQQKTQEWLKQELSNLQFTKKLLDKQLLTIENKRTECFAALEMIHILETQPIKAPIDILKDIKTRATNTLNKYSLHRLEELQMKKEHCEILKNSLEGRMKGV